MVRVINNCKPGSLAKALLVRDAILNNSSRVLTQREAIRIGKARI